MPKTYNTTEKLLLFIVVVRQLRGADSKSISVRSTNTLRLSLCVLYFQCIIDPIDTHYDVSGDIEENDACIQNNLSMSCHIWPNETLLFFLV